MSQGAEAAIDYTRDDLASAVGTRFSGGVDIVLDAIGGAPLEASLSVVTPGGVIVSVAGALDRDAVKARGVRFERVISEPSGEQLAVFAALAGRKKLRPHVQTIFPFADAALAQEESRAGHVRGKLVLAL
jgi:NADPH2:quinone reductase